MFDFDAFQKMKALAKEAVDLCRERVPTQRDRLMETIYTGCLADGLDLGTAFQMASEAAEYYFSRKDEGKKKCKCSDVK